MKQSSSKSVSSEVTEETVKQLCCVAFETLQTYLEKKEIVKYPSSLPDSQFPLFVTWDIAQSKIQRGCIGTFQSAPLSQNLIRFALISALQDHREVPISLKEVPELEVTVSLLHSFQEVSGLTDWQIGKHGLVFELEHQGKLHSSTYLPQIIVKEKWNQQQTLAQLALKAGAKDFWEEEKDRVQLQRYQAILNKAEYSDYQAYMKERA